MSYQKQQWIDRTVQQPNTYRKTDESGDLITLIPEPGEVLQTGTNITAARMNYMEAGIQDAQDTADGLKYHASRHSTGGADPIAASDISTGKVGVSVQGALDTLAGRAAADIATDTNGMSVQQALNGKANLTHKHVAGDINTGRLGLAQMPTSSTANRVLAVGATASADPAYQQVGLTTMVTGVLPTANGGLGVNPSNDANRITARKTVGLYIASGTVNVTAPANGNGSANITFPSGLFPDIPRTYAVVAGTGAAKELQACTSNTTATGTTIYMGNNTGSSVTNGVNWLAVHYN